MGKHTQEPWKLYRNDQSVGDANGFAVCDVWPRGDDGMASEEGKANARRIVACVNACEGIPTEDLEQSPRRMFHFLADFASCEIEKRGEVEKQRDELLDVQKDHHRLVRELDVLLNGVDGAAPQASLCDLVAQLKAKGGAA